jgi:hypothetical protein
MYRNTNILSEEICLKHGICFYTYLEWEWLACVTVLQTGPYLQTALHIQLCHNRFSKSSVKAVAKCWHPEQPFVKLSSRVNRQCEWSSSSEDKIVA